MHQDVEALVHPLFLLQLRDTFQIVSAPDSAYSQA